MIVLYTLRDVADRHPLAAMTVVFLANLAAAIATVVQWVKHP
jgi:hypothetical protein